MPSFKKTRDLLFFSYYKKLRFEKTDIPILADVLGLPDVFRCPQRTTAKKLEGLCILLRRLAFPCRYADMMPMFNRPVPELSMITNEVLNFIFENHSHRLTEWDERLLSPANLQVYADAIHGKGAALANCFGFVDGTVRPVCRPKKHQRIVYNTQTCSLLKISVGHIA